ncbi:MAG: toxin, partial [Muribaculaceae bacterium]|nr:toxin [Muribaculaceae bacterium]
MALRDEVEAFLASFHEKVKVFGILFRDDRQKNRMALIDLEISRFERLEIVKSIEIQDYSDGPIPDELNLGTEMWVFGKDVNGVEVYIKITMGGFNGRAICISFHRAE